MVCLSSFTCVLSISFTGGGGWLFGVDSWNLRHTQQSTQLREVRLHTSQALIVIWETSEVRAVTKQTSTIIRHQVKDKSL